MEKDDYIVINTTTVNNNGSGIYKIIRTEYKEDKGKWLLSPLAGGKYKIFNWRKMTDRIMKIKNIYWLNFINERDPWDFITKMQEFHELLEINKEQALDFIIQDRDYEIMNYSLNEEIFDNTILTVEKIDQILKSGDLLMMDVLAQYKIFSSDETLSWAINNNLTKIITYLLNKGFEPDIKDINWACKNLPGETIELLLIFGYAPDTAGTRYLLESDDLDKEALVKIFDLKIL
jgi:hypothetical protein